MRLGCKVVMDECERDVKLLWMDDVQISRELFVFVKE